MKHLLALVAGLFVAGSLAAEPAKPAAAAAPSAAASAAVNTKCPMDGKPVNAKFTTVVSKFVGFCSDKCKAAFGAEPALAKVTNDNATKGVNTICPLAGKPVKEFKTATIGGMKVAFCCDNCRKEAPEKEAEIIAKIKKDVVTNAKCPVDGKAVDAKQSGEFKQTVGFCCEKCKAAFDANPDVALAKVKKG